MKFIYYFIAKRVSYTFASSLYNILNIWLSSIFGYFLGIAFLTSTYYETVFEDIFKWFPLSLLLVSTLYFIFYGLLTQLKIPAFSKSLRLINNSISGNELNEIEDDNELKQLLKALSFFPIYNTISSAVFILALGLLLSGLSFAEHIIAETFTLNLIKEIFSIGFISSGVTAVIAGMITYLITDIVTSRERTVVYDELRNRGHRLPPVSNINISVKLSFFLALMIISLITFGAQIERGRYRGETDITLILIYFVVTVLIGFLLMYVNANSILRIFSDLQRVAREIATGGEGKFEFLPSESEFADIEFTIMEMKGEIDENRRTLEMKVEDRTKELQVALLDLKEKDELVQKQLDMAGTIQRGILPGKIDKWNGLNFSVRYLAMEKIGGDFYDIYQLGSNKISLLVADVSGHGIPAALVTAMAKISFDNAHLKSDSPKKIFQNVNQEMLDHVKTQDYLTCFIVVIDDDYNVTYANASHQKAMLLRTDKGEIELLDTGGLFIGAIDEATDTYEEKNVKLNYGDRLILYTDGIPEASNEDNKEYSNERLEYIIKNNKDIPLEDFTDSIIADLQDFMGATPMQDDTTLLVIELDKDESLEIMRNVKNLIKENKFHEAIDQLKDGLIQFPDNEKLLYNLAKNYFRVNDFNKSIESINKYIKNYKENKYAYYIGGTAYFQIKEYENAANLLEEALKLDPDFINALFASGMVYKRSGHKEKAVECFNKIIDIDSTNLRAAFELNEIKKESTVQ